MTTFFIEIEMDNDTMIDNIDIRRALQQVIGNVDSNMDGTVRDIIGHVVGKFGYRV